MREIVVVCTECQRRNTLFLNDRRAFLMFSK